MKPMFNALSFEKLPYDESWRLVDEHRWDSCLERRIVAAVNTRVTNIVDILSHTRPKNGCSSSSFHRRHALMCSMQSFKNSASKRYRYNNTVTIQNNTIKNIVAFTKRKVWLYEMGIKYIIKKSDSITNKSLINAGSQLLWATISRHCKHAFSEVSH